MESGLGFLHGNLTDVFPWVPHWDVSLATGMGASVGTILGYLHDY